METRPQESRLNAADPTAADCADGKQAESQSAGLPLERCQGDTGIASRDAAGFELIRLLGSGVPIDEIAQQVASLIPCGWRHRDVACARIVLHGQEYPTDNYQMSPWGQTADIHRTGENVGFVEVRYLEARPAIDEGPFSREERMLLNGIARQIETALNRERAGDMCQSEAQGVEANIRDCFLSHVSHEIRSPMTAILGYTDVLLENVHEPACIDAAITIKRNSCYLLNLINNLLDLSKLEVGELEVEKQQCSPLNIVADVASIMRVRAQMQGVSLKTEFGEPLPQTVVTDPLRLRQILINLVSNAIQFTPSGSICIATQFVHEEGQTPQLRFDIADTGVGLTSAQIDAILQPSVQPDASVCQWAQGAGLGLAITKDLVKLLGGTMTISSKPGEGSTFSVTIDPGPLDRVQMFADPAEALTSRHARMSVTANGMPRLAGRVLLVEDGRDNQRLIAYILRKAGAEVTIAENGQEAIDKILSNEAVAGMDRPSHIQPFDVVLMDMQMPVLDGYSATRRLRAMGYSGPIIALTAHAMSHDRQRCLEAGCDEYLTKPVEQRRLLDTVADFQIKARHESHRNALAPH